MSTANEGLVARLLADPDPRLKTAAEHPEFRKRIRVFLDGEDVMGRCRAFSIPGRTVSLCVKEGGRYLLDWTCGCGTVRGLRRPAGWITPRLGNGTCGVCGKPCSVEAATESLVGSVQVVPTDDMPSPLAWQITDRYKDAWFKLRLRWIALRGRLFRFARRAC